MIRCHFIALQVSYDDFDNCHSLGCNKLNSETSSDRRRLASFGGTISLRARQTQVLWQEFAAFKQKSVLPIFPWSTFIFAVFLFISAKEWVGMFETQSLLRDAITKMPYINLSDFSRTKRTKFNLTSCLQSSNFRSSNFLASLSWARHFILHTLFRMCLPSLDHYFARGNYPLSSFHAFDQKLVWTAGTQLIIEYFRARFLCVRSYYRIFGINFVVLKQQLVLSIFPWKTLLFAEE